MTSRDIAKISLRETGYKDVFKSHHDTAYDIKATPGGLYLILASKGLNPFRDDAYTSYMRARAALELYLISRDKFGNATYPSKAKVLKEKNAPRTV